MGEHSPFYPQVVAQIQAGIGETKNSVLEQVEWTLIPLKLDMSEDGADLEGDLA